MGRRHARYGSSNAHRWLACPASVKDDAPPEAPSQERSEGIYAHTLFAECLAKGGHPILENDTTEAVSFALGYVRDLKLDDLFIERYESFPGTLFDYDCGGTGDVIGWRRGDAITVHNIDFKHGVGVLVEAEENEQLLFNAVCALWHLPNVERIICTIIQPRHWSGAPIRSWECSTLELVEFKLRVDDALRLGTEQPDLEVPGAHCQFCPRAAICSARAAAGLAVVGIADVREAPTLPAPQDLPLDKLSHILENGAILTRWLKDVRDYAFDLAARRRVDIPGFKVVEARPERSFSGDEEAIARELSALSYYHHMPEHFQPPTLVGITKAEKMIKEGVRAHADAMSYDKKETKELIESAMQDFAFLTTKASSGSLTLVPLSDPRPPINPALVFKDVVLPPEGT